MSITNDVLSLLYEYIDKTIPEYEQIYSSVNVDSGSIAIGVKYKGMMCERIISQTEMLSVQDIETLCKYNIERIKQDFIKEGLL